MTIQMQPLGVALRIGVVSASLILASGIAIGTLEPPGVDAFAFVLAGVAALTLSIIGVPVSLDGAVINADGFVAVVAAQCTAIEIIVVFSAAVLVWPVSFRARIAGLLLGVAALCALNLVRVICLLLIGASFPEYFHVAHLMVWQTAMALAGLVIWLLWLRWVSNGERVNETQTIARS